jgi:putative nucleotidyltransferase with HDIG domain
MSKRAQDLIPPSTRLRRKIGKQLGKPLSRLSERKRFWLGFAALSLITTFLIFNPLLRTASDMPYREGDVAHEGIISPADIQYIDVDETDRLRQMSKETVKPIFTFETKRADEAVQSFRSSWENLQRKATTANTNAKGDAGWTGAGGADVGKVLGSRRFSANEIDAVTRVLREASEGFIYGDQDAQYFGNEIALVDRQKPVQQSVISMPESSMTSLTAARQKLREGLQKINSLSPREVNAFEQATAPLVQPTVMYDAAATDLAKATVAASVDPVAISLKRGQRVANEGDIITPEILSKITAIQSYSSSTRQLNRFFGLLIFISALYWAAWKFIQNRGIVPRLALSEVKTFALFGFIVVLQTALMAVFFKLADFTALQNPRAPLNDPSIWALAIPFATGSLLMTLLADRPIALFTGIFTALVAGFLAPRGLEFAIYAAIASSVAVYGIGRYRSRQTVTIAGSLVGVASAFIAIAMIAYTQQPFILNTVLLAIACGLAGGIATAAITAVFMPVAESLFGILTDVKLLELSNADLPILGQLALRAPGTNQHSHAVGQLAEEACRIVGGNALLTRIGALYHDIGKTAAPEHFVENQSGKNPHDRLKPAQSAKIIIAHVNYGMKLAREIGLPQRIIDFIPQHHGTRTLHYFLKKAQSQARSSEEVSENEFRYPGPKPQFKESAIMMIADSCEAAARTLAEPTPENVRYIVTKIVDAIVADDQLDECDLTLRELTQIREAMIRSLVAIYHSRIDYPGYTPPQNSLPRIVPDEDSEERGVMRYRRPEDIPISPGGEIEDEAVERTNEPENSAARSVSKS